MNKKSKLLDIGVRTSDNSKTDNSETVITARVTDASEHKQSSASTVNTINKLNEAVYTGMTGANPTSVRDGSFNNSYLKLGTSNTGVRSAEFWRDMITFDRETITAVYHGSWVFRRIIDKIAQDMWSAGISIEGAIPPEGVQRVQKRLSRLRSELIWATEQARLYGGAASLIMVNDGTDDLSKPLNLNGIKKGASIQLWSTDRWWGLSTSSEKVTNYKSKDFNTPLYYTFNIEDAQSVDSSNLNIKVHHSRVLRWVNRRSVRLINTLLLGWGISELEHLYQDLMTYENAKATGGSLLDKTLLEIVKVDGLRGIMQGLGLGSTAQEQELASQMAGLQNFRMNSTILLDKENDYQQFTATFTGVSELLETYKDVISGSAEMPKVLLYGDTKGGLTSDSPAEMEFYAQTINGKQEEMLRPVLDKLLPVIFASEGIKIPDDFDYSFENIAGITQERKLNLLQGTIQAVNSLVDGGMMTHETGLKEIQQVQKVTGFGSNIEERDVELSKKSDEPEPDNFGGEMTEEELPTAQDDYSEIKDEIEAQLPVRKRLFDKGHKRNKENN